MAYTFIEVALRIVLGMGQTLLSSGTSFVWDFRVSDWLVVGKEGFDWCNVYTLTFDKLTVRVHDSESSKQLDYGGKGSIACSHGSQSNHHVQSAMLRNESQGRSQEIQQATWVDGKSRTRDAASFSRWSLLVNPTTKPMQRKSSGRPKALDGP